MSLLTLTHAIIASTVSVDPTNGAVVPSTGFFGGSIQDVFHAVANTLIFLIGAISVIMVIIGGLRYALSGGNSKAVEDAKNTILYAIIGVVVAAAAYAIVNFVLYRLGQ